MLNLENLYAELVTLADAVETSTGGDPGKVWAIAEDRAKAGRRSGEADISLPGAKIAMLAIKVRAEIARSKAKRAGKDRAALEIDPTIDAPETPETPETPAPVEVDAAPEDCPAPEDLPADTSDAPAPAGGMEPGTLYTCPCTQGDQTTTTIKFFRNGIKINGGKLIPCWYSMDNRDKEKTPCVNIYQKKCISEDLPRDVFVVRNDTDITTDYVEPDSTCLYENHPLYKYARVAAIKASTRGEEKYIDSLRSRLQRPERWPGYYESTKEDISQREALYNKYMGELADLPKDHPSPATVNMAAWHMYWIRWAAEQEAEANRRAEEAARRAEVERETAAGEALIRAAMAQYPTPAADSDAPRVIIQWSEHPAFYSYADNELVLSYTAAEIVISTLDKQRAEKNRAEGRGGYDKTSMLITWPDGCIQKYELRYDLGDDDGGIYSHIKAFGENYRDWKHGGKPDPDGGAEIIQYAEALHGQDLRPLDPGPGADSTAPAPDVANRGDAPAAVGMIAGSNVIRGPWGSLA